MAKASRRVNKKVNKSTNKNNNKKVDSNANVNKKETTSNSSIDSIKAEIEAEVKENRAAVKKANEEAKKREEKEAGVKAKKEAKVEARQKEKTGVKRAVYLDNIRWIVILLLVPFHAGMAFNLWEDNYIYFEGNRIISSFVQFIWPWMMPVLFVVAGVSARYSMTVRTKAKFVINRVIKLIVPVVLGMIPLSVMTYYAVLSRGNNEIGYMEHFESFFSNLTDFTGYDGAFTIGHLWFLLALFLFSLVLVVFVKGFQVLGEMKKTLLESMDKKRLGISQSIWLIMLLGIVPFLTRDVFNICGKGILSYFIYFILGYLVMCEDKAVRLCRRFDLLLLALCIICSGTSVYMFIWMENANGTLNSLFMYMAGWFGVLTIIGLTRRYLNKKSDVRKALADNSFLFYILHFPVLIVAQYYTGIHFDSVFTRFLGPILIAYIGTVLLIVIIRFFGNLPGYITLARIVFTIYMLLAEPFSNLFFVLYFCAGITDLIDGIVARGMKLTSKKGAYLDSVADLFFAGGVLYVLLSNVTVPVYVWFVCLGIIVIKLISIIVSLVKYKKIIMLHTYLNKLAGIFIFMFFIVFQLADIRVSTIVIGAMAAIAAIEELVLIIKEKNLDENEKGYIVRTKLYKNLVYSDVKKDENKN